MSSYLQIQPTAKEKFRAYLSLMRVDRPIGTLLLLWPTYWGLWLAAQGTPPFPLFLIFTLGTWLMRSAGCVINDYFDRDFDRQVARTRDRPLASGVLRGRDALVLFVLLCLLAAALLPFLHPLVAWLALIAVAISVAYPLFKRFTHLPQAFLGLAFSFGIPMAFAAVRGEIPALAWWLMAANAAWVIAYDTAYAMADRPDDLRAGIRSTAILFGRYDRLAIALLDILMLAILAGIGWQQGLSWPYWFSLLGALALFVYQQSLLDGDRERAFRAFLHNNWIGLWIFWGLVASLPMHVS